MPLARPRRRLAALLIAGSLGTATLQCRPTPGPPPVVFIVVDTLRADRLGAYGYERATSPQLDELASHSWVFANASTPAPWTNPAMASIFTGRHPGALGITRQPIVLPAKATTLPEVLRLEGYTTHAVVSHFYLGRKLGFDQGFESWNEEQALGHAHVSSTEITDEALALLDAWDGERPMFLFLHYFDPHYDYREHDAFRFSDGYEGPLQSADDNIRALRDLAEADALDDDDLRHLNDLYDSEVAFTDHEIGRLLASLKDRGHYDDSLIVFTADHGESLVERPDRWLGHARSLYEEVLRVPLVIKPPGPAEGPRRVERPVSTVDLLPTLIDTLGLDPAWDESASERSLLTAAGARPTFAETYHQVALQSVRWGRWKLIHDAAQGSSLLFDLAADPLERQDVAAAEPELAARLEDLLDDWQLQLRSERKGGDVQPADFDEDELKQLEALGYLR
jgi:arylsulfatase A-like enzyme